MSRINVIVAVTKNMVIGKENDMPWHLPSDLKNFKKITDGSCVVMGRKCWESIPEKFRPLPNRVNVIVTRNQKFEANGAATLGELSVVLSRLKKNGDDDDVFVIGGGQVYKDAWPFAERLFMTRILVDIDGDIFLEGFKPEEWELTKQSEVQVENGIPFKFEEYQKKN